MILIPYWSDIADRVPWGTVGIIGVNIAVAILFGFPQEVGGSMWGPPPDAPLVNSFVLEFGTIHPLQWLTSSFTHGDWVHLGFNMIFLWTFGLIVEAHLSHGRFLLLYVAIALFASGITQILMLGSSGGAVGASDAIFGLMAVSAVWAPRNHVKVLFWIFLMVRILEVTVLGLCVFYVLLNLGQALLVGFAMSTPVLHLIGAGTGLGAGLWMWKSGRVDCAGWAGSRSATRGPSAVRASGPEQDSPAAALVRIRDALDAGKAVAADLAYGEDAGWELSEQDLVRLIDALCEAGATTRAAARMEQFLAKAPRDAGMRLRLAGILVDARRKAGALEHLSRLEEAGLGDEQRALKRELETRAGRGRGGLELE